MAYSKANTTTKKPTRQALGFDMSSEEGMNEIAKSEASWKIHLK